MAFVDDAAAGPALEACGLNCWAAPGQGPSRELPVEELIPALIRSDNARLRLAVIPLLLHLPEAARGFSGIEARLSRGEKVLARLLYTAAACLQRRWWTTLNLYARQTPLDDLYSRDLGIPPSDSDFGRQGLLAVAGRMRSLSALPCAYEEDFDRLIGLYLAQIRLRGAVV